MTTIMVIGGGLLQLPLIKTALRMKLRVIVTDYNPEAPGLKIADVPIVMSTKDVEGSVRVAKQENEKSQIHGVLTSGTDASMTVAAVANSLNLPGIKFEDAEAATNKIKMRTRFKEFNVPSPKFFAVWNLDEAKSACIRLSYPVVIKPSDNMGARGVRLVENYSDLLEAFHLAKKASPSGEIIVEEYMEGDELSIDAIVYNNEVIFTGIADRIIENLPYFIEKGHTMPSQLPTEILEEAKRVMRLGIDALGITHGFAKGDIKITKSGIKICELAARLSGGFMSTHTFPYSTGIDLMKAAIEISLGKKPENLTPTINKVSIERAIITKPGVINSITGLDEAKKINGVKDLILSAGVGDTSVIPKSNVDKVGHIITVGNSLEEAEAIVEKVRNVLKISVADKSPLTWKMIKNRARENFTKSCICCNECDGITCASSVPGMGGDGKGKSFIRNIESFSEYKIITRVLHSVSNPDSEIELFGKKLDFPVIPSPITGTVTNMDGSIEEDEYAHSVVLGAKKSGTIAMVGDGASPEKYRIGLSTIKENNFGGIPIFKPRSDINEILKRIKEAESSGVTAVGIDIDAIGFKTMSLKKQSTAPISSETLKLLVQSTELPLLVKGIMSSVDAISAVESGVAGIIVSNHGGRVLDEMPGTLDVLNDIASAVSGKVPVFADGGVRSGIDVFKALGLGADFVLIGRPVCIAAVGMKEDGVEFYLNSIKNEFLKTLVLTGCSSIEDICTDMVVKIT
jgi:isopentenyl diphosphate isomerase/L-lactate dehydrogenase-like FMN-dependent dehydrogenase/biotin carboxylase